jgi:hypothetical protein
MTASKSLDTIGPLPDYDEEAETVIAVVEFTHPGLGDGKVPGCLFFVVDGYTDPETKSPEIMDGYLWCPPSALESEHGSFYLVDLDRFGGRVLTGIRTDISFAECFGLPNTRDAVDAQIMAR